MRRRIVSPLTGLVLLGAFVVSCGQDATRGPLPTGPAAPADRHADLFRNGCLNFANLTTLAQIVFQSGPQDVIAMLTKLANLDAQVRMGNTAAAQAQARDIVAFIQTRAPQNNPNVSHDQIQSLISGVLCYAGLSPDTFLVLPSDQTQVLRSNDGASGIMLQPNSVDTPTLITITVLPPTTPPLDTKLDQYPGFIMLTQSSPLTKPAVVGVCPSAGIPTDVLARLRLGHQAIAGFEITPQADASFLNCNGSTAQSTFGKFLQRVASLVLPKPLYAKTEFSGGVGGLVTEFSPFAPVDPELNLRGGIGGTVTEFRATPPRDSGRSTSPALPSVPGGSSPSTTRQLDGGINTVVNGVCTQVNANVQSSVETECRPVITLTTPRGTVFQSVPVSWAIGQGGGVVAPEATTAHTCGAFASVASTTTNANGNASVCWTLGATPGTNTVIASPAAGGDAPAGVMFSPAHITFTALANQVTPTVGATGGSFVYDGAPHTGAGSCSNGLTPALTYSGGSAPVGVGSFTLTVTCGAGNPQYVTVMQTANIQITPAPTSVTTSCPASAVFTNAPLTPCTASVTGPGLSQSLTPTYTSNVNVGTATANAVYPAGGNYQSSNASATFQITPAASVTTVNCPLSVVFANAPRTPCTATATGPGLTATLTPGYATNVNVGTATASAAYAGGANYQASSAAGSFQITPAPTSTVVTCPTSVVYNKSAQTPCSATATGPGLSMTLTPTYTANVNVGTATATATYAGGGNYLGGSGSATFQITGSATSASVWCPAFVLYTGSPITPCIGSVTAPGFSQGVTPTYTSNVVGTATAKVDYPGAGNYGASSASKTFQIFYVQSDCFASPVSGIIPSTKSALKKGASLPLKCKLMSVFGRGVSDASGDLIVQDLGTSGLANPVTVLSVPNAFAGSNGGVYSYVLDSSPSVFVASHVYVVKASWSDGSASLGWFYLK